MQYCTRYTRNQAKLTTVLSRWRDVNICGLINVGAPGPRIERGDEGRELTLQHVVIVPVLSLARKQERKKAHITIRYSMFKNLFLSLKLGFIFSFTE
jgi:hypothetical protein